MKPDKPQYISLESEVPTELLASIESNESDIAFGDDELDIALEDITSELESLQQSQADLVPIRTFIVDTNKIDRETASKIHRHIPEDSDIETAPLNSYTTLPTPTNVTVSLELISDILGKKEMDRSAKIIGVGLGIAAAAGIIKIIRVLSRIAAEWQGKSYSVEEDRARSLRIYRSLGVYESSFSKIRELGPDAIKKAGEYLPSRYDAFAWVKVMKSTGKLPETNKIESEVYGRIISPRYTTYVDRCIKKKAGGVNDLIQISKWLVAIIQEQESLMSALSEAASSEQKIDPEKFKLRINFPNELKRFIEIKEDNESVSNDFKQLMTLESTNLAGKPSISLENALEFEFNLKSFDDLDTKLVKRLYKINSAAEKMVKQLEKSSKGPHTTNYRKAANYILTDWRTISKINSGVNKGKTNLLRFCKGTISTVSELEVVYKAITVKVRS